MKSNIRLLKMYSNSVMDFQNGIKEYRESNIVNNFQFRFRPLSDPDLIIEKKVNDEDGILIFDYYRDYGYILSFGNRLSPEIINDAKSMDEIELVLKYGRCIVDENIISVLSSRLQTDINLDDFNLGE